MNLPDIAPLSTVRNGPVIWRAEQVARIDPHWPAPDLISDDDFQRLGPDLDMWDAWPIQLADGCPAAFDDGATLWMALTSRRFSDPNERHGHARINLIRHDDAGWRDLGPVMPDGFSPGSREWSGSAVLADDGCTVQLYFTAAGRRGEARVSFEQRLFMAKATLQHSRLINWRDLREIVQPDPAHYMASNAGSGAVGTIKAFRDPAYFRDPADGRHYLFFAGSKAGSGSPFNGVIGAATASPQQPTQWELLEPLVSAEALNNELERPHVVFANSMYYMFWSTQSQVFNPDGPQGPTGLYGMVSSSLSGRWQPLNGSGLVFGNPAAAPRQAYSWLVLPDQSVISFVDQWGPTGGAVRFGASFAPRLQLKLTGSEARLV